MKNYFINDPAKEPNDTEFERYLQEFYIDPLKEFAFEFKGYNSLSEPDGSGGVHILRFENNFGIDAGSDYTKFTDICDADDDGQPHSTHRLHNGDLWIFIPYYS